MLIDQVRNTIEKYNMIQAGDQVLVALSGGSDSMALMWTLKELSVELGFRISALHVEHGIRGQESVRDMEYVQNFCSENNIDASVVRVSAPEYAEHESMSLEEAARILRYDALYAQARQLAEDNPDANVRIAVAHHMSDLAETVIFNMIRGSGLDGLAGIRPVSRLANDMEGQGLNGHINIIRPLLYCDKCDLEEYLRNKEIDWVHDSTNDELDASRNVIRQEILPKLNQINSQSVAHIAKSAVIVTSAADYIDSQVESIYSQYCVEVPSKSSKVLLKAIVSQEDFIICEVVHRWISECAGAMKDISSKHIEDTVKLLYADCGKCLSLPYGLTIVSEADSIIALDHKAVDKDNILLASNLEERFTFSVEKIPDNTSPKDLEIPTGPFEKWFDYDKISQVYSVRTRQTGDYLIVDDKGAKKSLKDYFINEKIPAYERDEVPLLCDGSHVMWVVGHRISSAFKIDNKTQRILKVIYK